MHNNFYFLLKLTEELSQNIIGSELVESYAQNKEELVLSFVSNDLEFYLKADFRPNIACLFFPKDVERANKHTQDKFSVLQGKKVEAIHVVPQDRSFYILFEGEHKLLFELYGRDANVLLYHHDELQEKLRWKLRASDKWPEKENELFDLDGLESEECIRKRFSFFGKSVWRQFFDKEITVEGALKVNEELSAAKQYFISESPDKGPLLSLFETPDSVSFDSPIEAINDFYIRKAKHEYLHGNKKKILTELSRDIRKSQKYLTNISKKLTELDNEVSPREIADVLMANLHQLSSNMEEVELLNFYSNENIIISLKKNLSPQKNAEWYYRKGKNRKVELDHLKINISARNKDLKTLISRRDKVMAIEEFHDMKLYLRAFKKEAAPKIIDKPRFKEFDFDGFKILVGRNSRNNDELTLKEAKKDDLWLHAKDVTGSHVVIKHKPGRKVPRYVLERAAELAAYYSKRKNDTLCPVIYTEKKWVRKRKGDPAGAVVVEREKVMMVTPRE